MSPACCVSEGLDVGCALITHLPSQQCEPQNSLRRLVKTSMTVSCPSRVYVCVASMRGSQSGLTDAAGFSRYSVSVSVTTSFKSNPEPYMVEKTCVGRNSAPSRVYNLPAGLAIISSETMGFIGCGCQSIVNSSLDENRYSFTSGSAARSSFIPVNSHHRPSWRNSVVSTA